MPRPSTAEADAALRASEAQFQSIMDHAPMMVSLRDLDGRFTFINRSYVAFAEQSKESILGRTVAELRSKEYGEEIAREDQDIIRQRRVIQREMTLEKADGPRTVLAVKFPVYDAHGAITGVGTVMADITEQKRIEIQLTQSQRIEALGQLTGGIAHDFNNLLTAILLNADVLTGLVDEKTRPLAEAVRMAAERGADLTRRLLAFGRRQMLEPRPTDIRDLLGSMEALMRRTLGEHIDIRFAPCRRSVVRKRRSGPARKRGAQPRGQCARRDAERRAAQHRDGKRRARCRAGGEQSRRSSRGTTSWSRSATPAPACRPTWSRARSSRSSPPRMSAREPGLGLSMVYGFVKQSGGHVRIHSEVGSGTVVRLYLPRSEAVAAKADTAPALALDLPKGSETILFVEDDPMVRKHTGMQIVGLGYAIVAAENAAEALSLVDDGCVPDLLFTDVVMPGGMNGRQLALRLRERWPRLRVLYTSGLRGRRADHRRRGGADANTCSASPTGAATLPPSCARCSTSRPRRSRPQP